MEELPNRKEVDDAWKLAYRTIGIVILMMFVGLVVYSIYYARITFGV